MITAIHHSSHQFTVHSLYTTKYIHSYHKWDSPKVLFSNEINFKVQHLWVMLVIPYIRTEISFSFYRDLKKTKYLSSLLIHTHVLNIQWWGRDRITMVNICIQKGEEFLANILQLTCITNLPPTLKQQFPSYHLLSLKSQPCIFGFPSS